MTQSKQESSSSSDNNNDKRYKGIRRRKWEKWVSEIRLPKTRDRLWLGSFFSPEAAAMAHDIAVVSLRGTSMAKNLNFPDCVSGFLPSNSSPRSIQKAASDAGAAIDAEFSLGFPESHQKSLDKIEIHGCEKSIWEDGYNFSNFFSATDLGEDWGQSSHVNDKELYLLAKWREEFGQ